jgi:hypothetical protein
MRASIQCRKCEKAALTVDLSEIVHLEPGLLQGEYSMQCPVCGPVFGVVIWSIEPIEAPDTVSV